MANYNENVSFQQGSDTGTAEPSSIVPISDAEVVWSGTTNRPIENLRQRTEILRRSVQDLRYFQDYDRGLILRSEGRFELVEPVSGSGQFVLKAYGPLWVYPTLTPGRNCGGRWDGGRVFFGQQPYLGTSPSDSLILSADAVSTGQRGYADGDTMATPTVLTLGANRITVDLVGDVTLATGAFQYQITQIPATKITIRYGTLSGAPSYTALIASLNSTTPINQILRASSPAANPAALYLTDFSGAVVQGAYDAEAHQVTPTQLEAFFLAFAAEGYPNRLRDGEGIAIGFPVGPVETYTAPYPRGGRRQSIFDLPTDRTGGKADNTTPVSGYSVFNTGREPEKIAGAVPIGKLVRILIAPATYVTEFVFIDGTRVRLGEPPVALGESGDLLRRLNSTVSPSGASLIGYSGSGNWNPNAVSAPTALPSGTVENALDEVVTQLGGFSANIGGARRIGFEPLTGLSSSGNAALNVSGFYAPSGDPVQSVQLAIAKLLNTEADTVDPGGVNYRVSERGHRMHGPRPIEKVFSELGFGTDTGGGQLIRAELNKAPNARTANQIEEQPVVFIRPFEWANYDASITIPAKFFVAIGSNTDQLELTTASNTHASFIESEFAITPDPSNAAVRLHCIVILSDAGSSLNGPYYVSRINAAATPPVVQLRTLAGGVPNFTGIAGTAEIKFYQTSIYGNDAEGNQTRFTVPESFSGAAHAYFGIGKIKQGYNLAQELRHFETIESAVWQYQDTLSPVNSGTGASTTTGAPVLANHLRVTNLANMGPSSIGRWLEITAASNPALQGTWPIVGNTNNTTVDILVPDALLSQTAVTAITWSERPDASRATSNILIKDDADLLRGVELTAPVDATANHHHGSAYTAVRFRSSAYSYPQVSDLSIGAPWFFETPNDAPSGYAKHAVLIYYRCVISVDGGAGGTDLVGLALEFAGSALLTNYRAGTVQTRMTKDAVGTPTLVLEGQLLVPLYFDPLVNFPTGASGFRAQVQFGSLGAGVNAALSTLDIDEIGYVLVRV